MTEQQNANDRGARILVVDDDDGVREGLARALTRAGGYEVATAADGFEAGYQLSLFKPDLIILDVVMPGMGGFDVCERIRKKVPGERLKIIILTGYAMNENSERSLVSGADLFLTKPLDVQTLLAHVQDLLD